jgi:lactate dehydrogenase-like 2-hydroxyacid dehydrogenase
MLFQKSALPLRQALAEWYRIVEEPEAAVRAIVGGGDVVVDRALMDRLPRLGLIAIHGVGFDGVDLAEARARGIAVSTTRDILNDDVADLALGLMLAVRRRLLPNDRVVRTRGWSVPLASRASGRRIGIFGMGAIGRAIAARAAPFATELLYCARSEKPDLPWRFVPDIRSLAAQSDVLFLIAPGGPETHGIVDAGVLAALGSDGVLVNVARGSLVHQEALVAALAAGTIAGAGLDVFADEPHVPAALTSFEQVVLSPHQGSATRECRADMAACVLANLHAFFAGEPLPTPLG